MTHIIGQSFNREKRIELVDILRRNFLYQTPQPIGDPPTRCQVIMLGTDWMRMLELIVEHGGWELPKKAVEEILKQEAEKRKNGGSDKQTDGGDGP